MPEMAGDGPVHRTIDLIKFATTATLSAGSGATLAAS